MKTPIAALFLALALTGAGARVMAQDTPPDPAPPAPEAKDDADKRHIVIDLDTGDGDEDPGVIGRALGTGLAAILENHVLTRDDLSEADRQEVREAIAELRAKSQKEAQTASTEVVTEVTKDIAQEVQDEMDAAEADARDANKHGKRGIVISTEGKNDDDIPAWVGPLAALAIIFTLGMPVIVVALILFFGYRKRRLAHDTINGYLASGKEIPPEVMQGLFSQAGTPAQAPRTVLHKGTINTGIGLGMVIGFSAIDAGFLAAVGCIFLLVGLAQLLIWKLEQGKKAGGETPQG